MAQKIVVLGAGVSGLTTALLLARKNNHQGEHITVVAKHMPGDYDIEYASPWAGASFGPGPTASRRPAANSSELGMGEDYERATWPDLEKLASSVPEAGVEFQRLVRYRREQDAKTPPSDWVGDGWYKHEMPDFKMLETEGLPAGIDAGMSVKSVCINVPIYLSWLVSQFLKHGIVFRRAIVQDITDALHLHHSGEKAELIVNCTGLSSSRLGGVNDTKLYPSRGQIVLVRNTSLPQPTTYSLSGTDDGPEENAYIIHRPAGGGCVLGGSAQRNNWESQPDPSLAVRIMKRCIELDPTSVPPGKGIEALSIIRHAVGLRPMRDGGPRVEREVIEGPHGKKVRVVHNYGHGGSGYELSYGAARAAVRLVEGALMDKI